MSRSETPRGHPPRECPCPEHLNEGGCMHFEACCSTCRACPVPTNFVLEDYHRHLRDAHGLVECGACRAYYEPRERHAHQARCSGRIRVGVNDLLLRLVEA